MSGARSDDDGARPGDPLVDETPARGGTAGSGRMERLVMTARLRPDAYERAQQLASEELPGGAGQAHLRGSTFLSPSEVVFVVEGEDADLHTREWFDDPVLSAAFSSWLPLFDGPLHAAREVGTWGSEHDD